MVHYHVQLYPFVLVLDAAAVAAAAAGISIEDNKISLSGDDALGTLRVLLGKILLKQATT